MKSTRVWTLPTRLFHWSFVVLILSAWISSDQDRWLSIHVAIGSAIGVLLVYRIIWGFMGPRYSRFSDFEFGMSNLKHYIKELIHPSRSYIGHNPAASYVMIAMLMMAGLVVLSGMALYGIQENRGIVAFLHDTQWRHMQWVKELHEVFITLLWLLIGAHVAGVFFDRLLHPSDKTLTSMINGDKAMVGEDARVTRYQMAVSVIGLGAAAGVLMYVLMVPNNLIIAAHTLKTDYAKENAVFANECSSCHTLYPPSLLPQGSWVKLMGGLSDHFGDDATLEPADQRSVLGYLVSHSAERSKQEMSVKIMQSLENRDIIAITQTPFWKRTHRGIAKSIFKSAAIKSPANCKACHSDVEQGTIEDSAIKALGKG